MLIELQNQKKIISFVQGQLGPKTKRIKSDQIQAIAKENFPFFRISKCSSFLPLVVPGKQVLRIKKNSKKLILPFKRGLYYPSLSIHPYKFFPNILAKVSVQCSARCLVIHIVIRYTYM